MTDAIQQAHHPTTGTAPKTTAATQSTSGAPEASSARAASPRHTADEVSLSPAALKALQNTGEPKPLDARAEHGALDRDGDGDVTRRDLRLDRESFAKQDADGNGILSRREFLAALTRANSFESLDRDGNGRLSSGEMAGLRRFDSRTYDRNGDASVDSSEFVAGRKAEMMAARRARLEDRLEGLGGDDLAKKVEKYDADGDGKVTASEVLEGRREAREKERAARGKEIFNALSGGGEELSVSDNKQYRRYDMNGDGSVSRSEFREGRGADFQKLRDNRYLNGAAGPELRERLGIDAAGRPTQSGIAGPVNVGSIEGLTWDKAADIIRSQGGKLFENGRPTVLAVRTDNAGTQSYDDVFVVLKPNGEMQTFAATTRPGFTTDSGGWSPDMVVPGNYRITPRPADGKWDDAFYVGTESGTTVMAAKDTNGDGRYSRSEIANPVSDDEIRLHRGNATSTSSAGCFNVQDYNAFLNFIGGRNASFDLTLVEG